MTPDTVSGVIDLQLRMTHHASSAETEALMVAQSSAFDLRRRLLSSALVAAATALGVEGEAIEWTPRAVRVSHVDKVGHQDTVRVWVSAVARRWAVASRTVWTDRYAPRQRKAPGQR